MLHSLPKMFRKFASIILAGVSDVHVSNLAKLFTMLADFLKSEPIRNFSVSSWKSPVGTYEDVPLNLNAEALARLKETVGIEFPDRIESGSAGIKDSFNFLYFLGQALTVILYMDYEEQEKNPRFSRAIKKLATIWGGEHMMSGGAMLHKYANFSNERAIELLTEKLTKSAEMVTEEIVPLFPHTQNARTV